MSVALDEDGLCVCCMLPPESCGTALVQRQAQERRAVRLRALDEPGVVSAAYAGACASCRTRYGVGEPIRKSPDGWTGALCCPREDET